MILYAFISFSSSRRWEHIGVEWARQGNAWHGPCRQEFNNKLTSRILNPRLLHNPFTHDTRALTVY